MNKVVKVKPLEQMCRCFSNHFFYVDTERYDQGLDDMIVFTEGVIAGLFVWTVLVNPLTGHFVCSKDGTETKEEWITEKSEQMQGTPWYDDLLGMIYCLTEEEGSHETV